VKSNFKNGVFRKHHNSNEEHIKMSITVFEYVEMSVRNTEESRRYGPLDLIVEENQL